MRFVRKLWRFLGPGFITGAADDDPSGIATYSIAGAQFGYGLNWLTVFVLPLMVAIQEMCGRIGMTTGMGLSGVIKKYYGKNLLYATVFLLFLANTINIGANLGMMAASLTMITGFPFILGLACITLITIGLEIYIPYRIYSQYLKWMAATLLVYVVTAFTLSLDWSSIIFSTLVPKIELTQQYLMTLVAFLGTTISPYLFFWQASEEVEESIKHGKIREFRQSPHVVRREIITMQKDTFFGMFFSQLITFFILLTAATTLHFNGITDIETPQQAALALKPLAGNLAYLLFTVGIIGIGLQSVPILAGSAAYAIAEAFGFKEGLSKKFTRAKAFYLTIAVATGVGALMNFMGINPIRALYYSAIINGVVAVPIIYFIIHIAENSDIVGRFTSTTASKIAGYVTFLLMGSAVIFMMTSLI